MAKIRFLMLGGFLGAGKTTTIARLAAHYNQLGKKVGIVTNDQAYDLVDTHTLRSQGFQVGEVPGACFCCKFDDLITTVGGLSEQSLPDIVIAEPVGSCTDLYATVIEPMRQLFGDRFELGPLIVLLKPEHGKKILVGTGRRGFSKQAEYIFLKQLEEADAIAVNKIDKLQEDQLKSLIGSVQEKFDDVPCFGFSARDGANFEALIENANRQVESEKQLMDVDYNVYAQGEAELGWLNCQVAATSDAKFELDRIVLDLTKELGQHLADAGFEIAHLKILGQTLENAAVANLVSSEGEPELSLASQIQTQTADVLVNARVAADPESMVAFLNHSTQSVGSKFNVLMKVGNVQSFRPAKPEPTHRAIRK